MELNNMLEETINGWILDYAFWQAWKEFKSFGSVDSKTDRDFLEACIRNPTFPVPYRDIQIRFLHLLTRLADGLNYSMTFNDGTVGTVLESGFYHFSKLMSHFPDMFVEYADISHEFLYQAVFVCCIDNNFSMAKTVFNRLGSNNILKMKCFSSSDVKAIEEEIQPILSSKNSKHPTLIKKDYYSFIRKIIEFLETIYKSVPEPLLIMVFEDRKRNCSVLPSKPINSTTSDDQTIKDKSSVEDSNEIVIHSSSHELESRVIDVNSNSVSLPNSKTALSIESKGEGLCCSSATQKKLRKAKDDVISDLEKASDGSLLLNDSASFSDRSEINGFGNASLDDIDKKVTVSNAKRQKINEMFQYLLNCHRKISPESIRILKSRMPPDEKSTSTEILKATIRSRLQKLGLSVEDLLKPATLIARIPELPDTPSKSMSKLLASQSILETPRLLKVLCVPMEKDKSIPAYLRREIKKELLTASSRKRLKQSKLSFENHPSDSEKVDNENSVVQTPESRLPFLPKGMSRCRRSLLCINSSQKENNNEWLSSSKLPKENPRGQSGRVWTEEEELALYEGIVKYGPGKWAFIRDEFDFNSRTVINISDKWRNLKKNPVKLKKLKKKFELQMKKL